MKKTRNISLAGIGFTLDDDAYAALEAYIDSLHRAYDSDPNGAEIIADIEARIAELILSEQSYQQVVPLAKINIITAQLGSPEQQEGQESSGPHKAEPQAHIPRRLHRWREGRILGGVCAGMGQYWDINPMWLRLGFITPLFLAIFFSILSHILSFSTHFVHISTDLSWMFLSSIIYIALWIIIPLARTPRQKLEGRGEKITSESIHRNFQAEATPTPEGRMQASREAQAVDSGRSALLVILRVLAGFAAVWVLLSWLAMIGVMTTASIANCSWEWMADFDTGLEIFSGVFGNMIWVMWFVVGLISLPWLMLDYALFVFAFGGRIRGWVFAVIVAVWIAALTFFGIKAVQQPSSADNLNLREQLELLEEQLDNLDENALFEALDELDLESIHDARYYHYTSMNPDSTSTTHHVIQAKDDNNRDVVINIDERASGVYVISINNKEVE
ncbi:MAG: PspC domain-containing protein [Rikenellaceae bacterium]|nr:PspC domain-containing protein [Rikenellaceae bacterium]